MLDLWHPVMTPQLRRVEVRQLITTTVTPQSMLRAVYHAPMKPAKKLWGNWQKCVLHWGQRFISSGKRLASYPPARKPSRTMVQDLVQDLTGLPSFAKLMVVFTFVSEFLKVGPGLSPFQIFLMTPMRMRLNLPLHFVSFIFHVSKPTAGRIFNSTLNVLHDRLSRCILWPSKE